MHNPPHPGEFIEGVYLEPCALSIRQVAERLGVSASTFQRVLGRSAENWLAMQDSHDLWQAHQRLDLSGLTLMELTPAQKTAPAPNATQQSRGRTPSGWSGSRWGSCRPRRVNPGQSRRHIGAGELWPRLTHPHRQCRGAQQGHRLLEQELRALPALERSGSRRTDAGRGGGGRRGVRMKGMAQGRGMPRSVQILRNQSRRFTGPALAPRRSCLQHLFQRDQQPFAGGLLGIHARHLFHPADPPVAVLLHNSGERAHRRRRPAGPGPAPAPGGRGRP